MCIYIYIYIYIYILAVVHFFQQPSPLNIVLFFASLKSLSSSSKVFVKLFRLILLLDCVLDFPYAVYIVCETVELTVTTNGVHHRFTDSTVAFL